MNDLAKGPEFDLIRAIVQNTRATHPMVRVGPGDDCAIIGNLAISTDASVENVHFRRAWLSAQEIGWRAAAAALSDLAAVAAQPVGILVSNILPAADASEFAQDLMRGAVTAVESVGGMLIGGDLASGATLVIDVIAVGSVEHPVLRSGARAGHQVWVTGRLGGAAAAVAAWLADSAPSGSARVRYAHPLPRIAESLWLAEHAQPGALIDLSDGLYGDAAHIAAASGCAIVIDSAAVPVDAESGASFAQAVGGGEDYELCFTAPPGIEAVAQDFEREFGVQLSRIGEVIAGSGVHERDAHGVVKPAPARGYQHFGAER